MIKIESPVGNIIMFDEIAIELIKMMGKNPTLPGALLTKDMGLALRTLQKSLQINSNSRADLCETNSLRAKDDDLIQVSLEMRAKPLIEIMEKAIAAECDIIWRHGN